jgi:LysR family hydrogen peroxide-inducible transcriptional activator
MLAPVMPTLRQLRYLVAVADTLNFRRAAERCHVSQPSLSGQIKELEARLKVQLVERSRRRVVVTPVGREVVERARRVLRDVHDLVDVAERGRHILAGTLRLGVLPSLGPYLLPHILPYLHQRYPQLTLYLREDAADALLRRLDEGDLDLLFYPLPLQRSDFTLEALFREPLLLALPPEHPLAARQTLVPDDLKDLTILALEGSHSLHRKLLALCEAWGARPLLDYATTSLDTLRQMAAMGLGATFLPALYIRTEVRHDSELAVRPFVPPGPSRDIALVWRSMSARRGEYRMLAAHIREILAAEVPEVTVLGG